MADVALAKRSNPRRRRRLSLDGPTDKERDYLEIIYYLSQRDEPVIAAHLARWLDVQPPTVSHMVQELQKKEKAYIQRSSRGNITLTEKGFQLAELVVRRHRMLERFMADVVGMPWHLLHEEAVRLENALSPALEERIVELVGNPTHSPYGNPIPGSGAADDKLIRLDTAPVGSMFTVRRVVEEAEENTDLLRYLQANELIPATEFFVPGASPAFGITLRRCGHDITLSAEIAAILWGESTPIPT